MSLMLGLCLFLPRCWQFLVEKHDRGVVEIEVLAGTLPAGGRFCVTDS